MLDQRVLGLGQDALECRFVEVLEGRHHREPADELGDQPVLEQVFGLHLAEDLAGLAVLRRDHLGGEADGSRTAAGRDDLLQA